MTAPFKGPIQNEPQPEIGIAVLCTATKTTTNITKTTDDYHVQLEPVLSIHMTKIIRLVVNGNN